MSFNSEDLFASSASQSYQPHTPTYPPPPYLPPYMPNYQPASPPEGSYWSPTPYQTPPPLQLTPSIPWEERDSLPSIPPPSIPPHDPNEDHTNWWLRSHFTPTQPPNFLDIPLTPPPIIDVEEEEETEAEEEEEGREEQEEVIVISDDDDDEQPPPPPYSIVHLTIPIVILH